MPPAIIPNRLHFIWLGARLPEKYAANLLSWLIANPAYEVHLWTESGMVDVNREAVLDALKTRDDYHPLLNVTTADVFDGKLLTFEGKDPIPHQLLIQTIATVPAISDPGLLYEEMSAWKNYGAASDILRLWVLHHRGGIYMDFDTEMDGGKPLPLLIRAPLGILFADFHDGTKTWVCNAIMAAAENSPNVLESAKALEKAYDTHYPENRLSRCITTEHLMGLNKVIEARHEHAIGGRYAHMLSATIGVYMANPTYERGASIVTGGIGCEFVPAIYNDISFQKQSGYNPILRSDDSWQK